MTTVLVILVAGLIVWNIVQYRSINKLKNDLFHLQLNSTARGMPSGDAAVEQLFRHFLQQTNPKGLAMYDEYLRNQQQQK
jgi:hypothetical protein